MGDFWTKPDEGGGITENLAPGDYDGTIARVVTVKKDGEHLASRDGDAQVMVVLEDVEQTGEATCTVTLSDKGAWVLKALLKAVNTDMAALDASEARLSDFAEQDVCDQYLTGKALRFRVTHKKSPTNGQTYANALPIVPADAPKLADTMRKHMTPDNSPKGKKFNSSLPI